MRHELRAAAAREHIPRAELITDEQGAVALEQKRAVPGRVTGSCDYAGIAGDLEDVALGECLCVVHRRRPRGARQHHLREHAPQQRAPHLRDYVHGARVARLWARLAELRLTVGMGQGAWSLFPE